MASRPGPAGGTLLPHASAAGRGDRQPRYRLPAHSASGPLFAVPAILIFPFAVLSAPGLAARKVRLIGRPLMRPPGGRN